MGVRKLQRKQNLIFSQKLVRNNGCKIISVDTRTNKILGTALQYSAILLFFSRIFRVQDINKHMYENCNFFGYIYIYIFVEQPPVSHRPPYRSRKIFCCKGFNRSQSSASTLRSSPFAIRQRERSRRFVEPLA